MSLFSGPNLVVLALGLPCVVAFLIWKFRQGGGVSKSIGKAVAVTAKVAQSMVPQRQSKSIKSIRTLNEAPQMQGEAPKEEVKAEAKPDIYPAMVYTPAGIVFKKIPEKVGPLRFLDPSMPAHGDHYVVEEIEPGKYVAFDPRHIPVVEDETPEYAWDGIEWDKDVQAVWANKYGLWDKINMFLIGGALLGMFLVAIVGLDKIGKH